MTGKTAGDAEGLVSVVIPTYYRNDELRATLASVFGQTYPSIEIIVVDDSGERHAAPVAADDDRLRYLALEENRGAHAAREAGVQHARGRYVQLLDDDDRLFEEKLTKQLPLLQSNPDVGVVYCGLRWEDGPTVLPNPEVRGDVLKAALRFATAPAMMGTMLIERDVLDRILPFRHHHGADDIGMKIELARVTAFDFVNEVLLHRGNSRESVGTSRAAVEGRKQIIEMYDDLYAEYPDDVRREALAETYLVSGQFYLNEYGWSPVAIAEFARACYHVPGVPLLYLGSLLAALFGRRGYRTVRRLYSSVVLGDREGKAE